MVTRHRDSDDELSPGVRAELVANRQGQPRGLRLHIPLAALAGIVGFMGLDATKSRGKIEESVTRQAQEIAVLQSQQENIRATLIRIEALLEMMRQRQDERERRR